MTEKIIVFLAIAAAAVFVGRRIYRRISGKSRRCSSCAKDCPYREGRFDL